MLGVLAIANFVDLVPAIANATGVTLGSYYYVAWIRYVTLPLTALTLLLGSVAIGLGKWAATAPGRKLEGPALYPVIATIAFMTAKFGVLWIAHLRHGRTLTLPLWIVAVLVGTTAIWATVRERDASRRGRPSLVLWGLFVSLFLAELVVGAF